MAGIRLPSARIRRCIVAAIVPFPLLGMGYFAADPSMPTFHEFRATLQIKNSSHPRRPGDLAERRALSADAGALFGAGAKGPRADRYLEVKTTSYIPRGSRVIMASLTGGGFAPAAPAGRDAGAVTGSLAPPPDLDQDVTRSLKGSRLLPVGQVTAASYLNALRDMLMAPEEEDTGPVRLPRNLAYQGETEAEYQERQRRCLATAIYFESRGEPIAGQKAVAQVVMNRVRSPDYPDTICGVVYQGSQRRTGCQFSFTCDGKPDVPRDMTRWGIAMDLARKVTEGEVWLDNIGHATHFHATYVNPRWVRDMNRVQRIGQHIFYRIRNERPYEVPDLPSSGGQGTGLAFSGSG